MIRKALAQLGLVGKDNSFYVTDSSSIYITHDRQPNFRPAKENFM